MGWQKKCLLSGGIVAGAAPQMPEFPEFWLKYSPPRSGVVP
jgi:hypothetical protein